MPGFGLYNPFPFEFGGDISVEEVEHNALLDAGEEWGFSKSEDTTNWAECAAYAGVLASIWAVNDRVSNQMIADRMLENLVVWEEACGLRPGADELDIDRRRRLSGRQRAAANNSLGDIHDVASTLCGANYEQLVLVAPTDQVTYWPGVNPGPPATPWSSNRARVGIRLNKNGLTEAQFQRLRSELYTTVDAMLSSAWTLTIGTGTGFTLGSSLLGQAFV